MMGHMEAFSPAERALIRQYAQEFKAGTGVEQSLWEDSSGKARAGIRVEATTKLDAGGLYDLIDGSSSTALRNVAPQLALVPYLKETRFQAFAEGRGRFHLGQDRERSLPSLRLTKEWDATLYGSGRRAIRSARSIIPPRATISRRYRGGDRQRFADGQALALQAGLGHRFGSLLFRGRRGLLWASRRCSAFEFYGFRARGSRTNWEEEATREYGGDLCRH